MVYGDTKNEAINKDSRDIDQESMVENTAKFNQKLRSFNADTIKSGHEI